MKNVLADMHCRTWEYSYSGYRKYLSKVCVIVPRIEISFRRIYFLKRFLKQDKERVFYKMGDTTICSYENYDYLEKLEKKR